MLDGDIVPRDGKKAGQARFGREQVVIGVVQRMAGEVIPDREQLASPVVEKPEIHLAGEVVGASRQRVQLRCQFRRVRRCPREREQRLT